MNRDGVRTALSIVVLIALAAYAFVVRPMEATIAARYSDIDTLRATTERDLALARRLPAATAERSRLESRLDRQHVHLSRAALVDDFLHATARVVEHNGISVQTIVPGPPVENDTLLPALEALHLDLTVRGPYGNVLRAMRELNDTAVTTQITVAALGNADRISAGAPQLNATFHITLLRESDANTAHASHSV
jgi:Tfp pilus assembly protein PilO